MDAVSSVVWVDPFVSAAGPFCLSLSCNVMSCVLNPIWVNVNVKVYLWLVSNCFMSTYDIPRNRNIPRLLLTPPHHTPYLLCICLYAIRNRGSSSIKPAKPLWTFDVVFLFQSTIAQRGIYNLSPPQRSTSTLPAFRTSVRNFSFFFTEQHGRNELRH